MSSSFVAVDGLNGDAFATWTHGKTGMLWLETMLFPLLPDTRIMTYGYNAKFVNFTSKQDLYSISVKLLSELADLRTTEEVLLTNHKSTPFRVLGLTVLSGSASARLFSSAIVLV